MGYRGNAARPRFGPKICQGIRVSPEASFARRVVVVHGALVGHARPAGLVVDRLSREGRGKVEPNAKQLSAGSSRVE